MYHDRSTTSKTAVYSDDKLGDGIKVTTPLSKAALTAVGSKLHGSKLCEHECVNTCSVQDSHAKSAVDEKN